MSTQNKQTTKKSARPKIEPQLNIVMSIPVEEYFSWTALLPRASIWQLN